MPLSLLQTVYWFLTTPEFDAWQLTHNDPTNPLRIFNKATGQSYVSFIFPLIQCLFVLFGLLIHAAMPNIPWFSDDYFIDQEISLGRPCQTSWKFQRKLCEESWSKDEFNVRTLHLSREARAVHLHSRL